MSLRDNLYNNLRLKPYITFDKDNYLSKLFSFDGTVFTSNKDRFMFLFDYESQQFIWSNDLRDYVADHFGTLVYKVQNVRSLIFEKPTFKIIIVDLHETYMVVTKHDLISLYYKQDGSPIFNYKSSDSHLLFYDSKSIKRKRYVKKKSVWYDLPLMVDFDFTGGQLFSNVSEFSLVYQIIKERQFLVDAFCQIKGDLTYSQILNASSYQDILKSKYKLFDEVNRNINLDNMNYWEFGLIRQLMLKLTCSEFKSVVSWYNTVGRNMCLTYWSNIKPVTCHTLMWYEIYYIYLADKFNVFNYLSNVLMFDDFYHIKRYVDEYRDGYGSPKLDSSHIVTLSDLNMECNKLIIKNCNLRTRRYYNGQKISKNGWRPLLSKISESTLDLNALCSIRSIVKNAIDNHINFSTYIEDIINGKVFVLNYNDGLDDYTIIVSKSSKNKYEIKDVYQRSKFDVVDYKVDLSDIQPVVNLLQT